MAGRTARKDLLAIQALAAWLNQRKPCIENGEATTDFAENIQSTQSNVTVYEINPDIDLVESVLKRSARKASRSLSNLLENSVDEAR